LLPLAGRDSGRPIRGVAYVIKVCREVWSATVSVDPTRSAAMSAVSFVAVRPLRTPALLCIAALWMLAGLSLVRAAATPLVLAPADAGDPVVLAFNLMITLYAAGSLFTAVAFMVWLYQARENLDRRGETGMRWSPGWTIGGWFIPLANFVIPARVVGEVYARSMPGAIRTWQMPSLVTAWWVAFLLSLFRFTYSTVGPDHVVRVTGLGFWNVVNGLAGCVAAVLAVHLIRRVTAWQAAWGSAVQQPV
jgi:hypothetical protein